MNEWNPDLTAGQRLLLNGRPDLAEPYLRKGLAVSPGNAVGHACLAESLLGRRAIPDARSEALTSISLAPEACVGHAVLAGVEVEAGRWRQAEAAIRDAIRLHPEEPDHYGVLAFALLQQGRPGRALAAVSHGLGRKPNDPMVLNVRALALADLGRIGEARDVLRGALVSRPESAILHCNLAFVLISHGEPEAAREAAREALRLDPTSEIAQRNLRASELAITKPLALVLRRAATWWHRRPLWERSVFLGGLAALTPISLVTGLMAALIGTCWLALSLVGAAHSPGNPMHPFKSVIGVIAAATLTGAFMGIPLVASYADTPLAGFSAAFACLGLAIAAGTRRPYRQLVFGISLVVIAIGGIRATAPIAAIQRPRIGVVDDRVIPYRSVWGSSVDWDRCD
jgi:Flp pilus assembly protein TadD